MYDNGKTVKDSVNYSDEYLRIRKEAESKWPAWKISIFDSSVAVSAHAKKKYDMSILNDSSSAALNVGKSHRTTQTAFCINCGCKNKYMEAVAEADSEVNGVKFSYVEALALCEECGDELYVPDINDRNVQSREAAHRKAVSYFDE